MKKTLVIRCLASHFGIIVSWKLIVGHLVIYFAKKILNAFVCVEVRFLVEKWNVNGHIFPRPLLQKCRLETNSLCLYNRLLVKKIQILKTIIEININVCLLFDHHIMKGIILHTRRPKCQKKVCYALGFYVSADFRFSHFRSWKAQHSI